MSYRIDSIELYMRETPPGRMSFALGAQGAGGGPGQPLRSPLAHVRMILRDSSGGETFGCAADRLSVRWLDKRPDRTHARKLRELVRLIGVGRDVYLARREFASPFAHWLDAHRAIMEAGRSAAQEDLTATFVSALFERAMLDGVARLAGQPLFGMVRDDRLGVRAVAVHPQLTGFRLASHLPATPVTRHAIRHTVGLSDPVDAADLPPERRLNDGLPETLTEYIESDGVHFFKVKISGTPHADLARLARIWDVLPKSPRTAVTLDANESYPDLGAFATFVGDLERALPGLFQHILYIEQPLPRRQTLDSATAAGVQRIAEAKPLIIDEADGSLDAFARAHQLGYAGTSHKDCKGFFKSLLNLALAARYREQGRDAFLSAEDLQNLPIVPLHQDFASLALLGLRHCERNGHHYNRGLSMLSRSEREAAAKVHPDLYVQRGDEWFLNIRDGYVDCASLQCPGYGVSTEPDWPSMRDLDVWLTERYPG